MAVVPDIALREIISGLEVKDTNLRFCHAWMRAEGGNAAFNPFNTTLPAKGSYAINSVGVQSYPDIATGVAATIKTLKLAKYYEFLTVWRNGASPYYLAVEIARSPWGTDGWLLTQVLHDTGVGAPKV